MRLQREVGEPKSGCSCRPSRRWRPPLRVGRRSIVAAWLIAALVGGTSFLIAPAALRRALLPSPAARAHESSSHGVTLPASELAAAVTVRNQSAYWSNDLNVRALDDGDGPAPVFFIVRGEIENTSARPLHYVKLAYDLLDAEGNVVASEWGYNRGGEGLRPLDSPNSWPLDTARVAMPIARGGRDTFRMLFLRKDVPAFATYRVRVIEAITAKEESK